MKVRALPVAPILFCCGDFMDKHKKRLIKAFVYFLLLGLLPSAGVGAAVYYGLITNEAVAIAAALTLIGSGLVSAFAAIVMFYSYSALFFNDLFSTRKAK